MTDDIKTEIKKYIISEFSKITYRDEFEITDNSFLYSNLCLDIMDILSVIIQIEDKFSIHIDENKINLYDDMTVDEFCDLICGSKKDFKND